MRIITIENKFAFAADKFEYMFIHDDFLTIVICLAQKEHRLDHNNSNDTQKTFDRIVELLKER